MFREKYKKDNEMVNPSDEFLEKLKMKMKEEESLKSRHKINRSKKILLTAASIALVFVSVAAYNKIFSSQESTIIQPTEISDNAGKNEGQSGLFSNSKWYDSSLSSEEIYHEFITRMSSQNDLNQLSVSNSNEFTEGDIMKEPEVTELVNLLKAGTLIKDESYSKENPKYYMANFKNGDVIKFTIYDNKYFECNEFEGKFLI